MFDIKATIIAALLVVIVVLSTCKSCQQSMYERKIAKMEKDCAALSGGETTIDTIYRPVNVSVVDHSPIPVSTSFPKLVIHRIFDTLYIENVDTVFIDTLVARHYATNYYENEYNTDFGTIATYDTVSQNQLIGKSIINNLIFPSTKETKTIIQRVRRPVIYLGVSGYGNTSGINGVGASLMYQSPRALNYGAGASIINGGIIYNGTVFIPLTKK